ncbi:hypothetical protein VNO80_21377 [Phaseolus coccineus]|uniref:Uncharacterized protein n=1 Tax=Phaseolus coccineus TaxID=3886 RepID=A0AAN9M615_PHACN
MVQSVAVLILHRGTVVRMVVSGILAWTFYFGISEMVQEYIDVLGKWANPFWWDGQYLPYLGEERFDMV